MYLKRFTAERAPAGAPRRREDRKQVAVVVLCALCLLCVYCKEDEVVSPSTEAFSWVFLCVGVPRLGLSLR